MRKHFFRLSTNSEAFALEFIKNLKEIFLCKFPLSSIEGNILSFWFQCLSKAIIIHLHDPRVGKEFSSMKPYYFEYIILETYYFRFKKVK